MGDNSERRVFYFKNMRKLIDLNEETFKTLSKLAIDNNTNLKSYIESILVTHAGGALKIKNLPLNVNRSKLKQKLN